MRFWPGLGTPPHSLADGSMFVSFLATTDLSALARSNLQARPWGIAFTGMGIFALIGVFIGAFGRRDGFPFSMTMPFFLSAFLTLGTLFWPYIIPYAITIGDAAAPRASLRFLFYGAALVLPFVVAYIVRVYWFSAAKSAKGIAEVLLDTGNSARGSPTRLESSLNLVEPR